MLPYWHDYEQKAAKYSYALYPFTFLKSANFVTLLFSEPPIDQDYCDSETYPPFKKICIVLNES